MCCIHQCVVYTSVCCIYISVLYTPACIYNTLMYIQQCVLYICVFYIHQCDLYISVFYIHQCVLYISVFYIHQCNLYISVLYTPGWVKDTTGSYNIIFYTALAQGVIAFIVIVAIVCCTRHSPDANTIAMDTDDVDHREGTCNLAFTANLDEFCTHL